MPSCVAVLIAVALACGCGDPSSVRGSGSPPVLAVPPTQPGEAMTEPVGTDSPSSLGVGEPAPTDDGVGSNAGAGAGDSAPAVDMSGVEEGGGIDAGVTVVPDSPRCEMAPLAPGDHPGSVEHDGRERGYVIHVPPGLAGESPVPLVVDFHGFGSSGEGQMRTSGFRELADRHGFVAVYPDGVGGSWHVNGCCGQAAELQLDEVGAVRALVADVTRQVCVDERRIYASGISQGGGMAHHVACLAADLFAAVAPVSSDLRTEPCDPTRPISQMSFRGTADGLSAYEGGPVGPPGGQYQSIGARETLEAWRLIDGCTPAATETLELCETHAECEAGVEVTLCTLPGAGHVLYDNPSGLDVAAAAWSMFERQVR